MFLWIGVYVDNLLHRVERIWIHRMQRKRKSKMRTPFNEWVSHCFNFPLYFQHTIFKSLSLCFYKLLYLHSIPFLGHFSVSSTTLSNHSKSLEALLKIDSLDDSSRAERRVEFSKIYSCWLRIPAKQRRLLYQKKHYLVDVSNVNFTTF